MKLSSEFLDPVYKKRLNNNCANKVEALYDRDKELVEEEDGVTSLIAKLKRKAYVLAVNSLRRKHVLKYIENRSAYVLPRKG